MKKEKVIGEWIFKAKPKSNKEDMERITRIFQLGGSTASAFKRHNKTMAYRKRKGLL